MIIAIDGPAAAGKGTLAQNLAKHFHYAFLDTGRLYRAVGYAVLQAGEDPSDESAATREAKSFDPKSINKILSNPALRDEATGNAASKVAVIPAVRSALLDLQRNFAKEPFFEDGTPAKGAVLDGRDIGTVVCPDADVKFFVTASLVWHDGARLNVEYQIEKSSGEIAASGYTVQMFFSLDGHTPALLSPALLDECRERWKRGEFHE